MENWLCTKMLLNNRLWYIQILYIVYSCRFVIDSHFSSYAEYFTPERNFVNNYISQIPHQ